MSDKICSALNLNGKTELWPICVGGGGESSGQSYKLQLSKSLSCQLVPLKSHTLQSQRGGAWQLMGDEGLHLPNCQTNLVVVLHALPPMIGISLNTTAYSLGRYKLKSSMGIETVHEGQ